MNLQQLNLINHKKNIKNVFLNNTILENIFLGLFNMSKKYI